MPRQFRTGSHFCAEILWKKQIPVNDPDRQRQIINRSVTLVQQAVQRVERTGTNGLFWTSSVNSTSADEAGTNPRF